MVPVLFGHGALYPLVGCSFRWTINKSLDVIGWVRKKHMYKGVGYNRRMR
jgi:hypothetical protein